MKFLNKLERKFGRFAIPNLTLFIIGAYIIGYVFTLINPEMMHALTLNPYYILKVCTKFFCPFSRKTDTNHPKLFFP